MRHGGNKVVLNREEVRSLMVRLDVRSGDVAKNLSISSGHWSHLMNGDRCPGPELRMKIRLFFSKAMWNTLFTEVPE